MASEIIVALISGGFAFIGTLLGFIISNKELRLKKEEAQNAQLEKLKKDINEKLDSHNTDYIAGIDHVKAELASLSDEVNNMKATYQQTVAIIECKIDNLEKKQDKHNSIIERTYALESDVAVLKAKME